VRNRKQYDAIVDTCPTIPNERRSFLKKFGACPLDGRVGLLIADNGEVAQRETIHIKTHTMTRDVFGSHAPWLFEALANSTSTALKNADLKVCFSGRGSTGGIQLERMSLDQAPTILREKVKKKKDPDIQKFVPLPADGMSALHIAKAWSVLMFLLERDQEQCREYLSRAGQGPEGKNSKSAKVLKQFFPEYPNWADLDAEWRDWAIDVYKDR
jgi:hypothetical protein